MKDTVETTEVVDAVDVINSDGEVVDNPMVIILRKPYTYEGKTYEKIDLSGLDNLTADDMIAASRVLDRSGSFSFLPEMTVEYACVISARATKLPIEFFKGLPPKDAMKLKNRVTGFLYGAD
jgi:hypothetical protein